MTGPGSRAAEFHSRRISFRRPQKEDIAYLCGLYADPELMRHILPGGGALDPDRAMAKAGSLLTDWERRGLGMYLMSLRADPGRLIGYCGFKSSAVPGTAELGYILGQPWWGRGLATEAARRCVELARDELGLERLVAVTAPDAAASQKILSKAGFVRIPEQGEVMEGSESLWFECHLKP